MPAEEQALAPAQPNLPTDIQKAIQSAFEDLREKAWSNEEKLAKAQPDENQPKAWLADPFALLDSVGMGYRNAPTYLTYDTLRQVSERDTYVCPIIFTRVDQVASFAKPQVNKYSIGFRVRPRHGDPDRLLTRGEQDRVKFLTLFLQHTGREHNLGRDDFEVFLRKFVRDSLTYDQTAFEKVPTRGRGIYSMQMVPSDTIRTATPKQLKGTPPRLSEIKQDIRYVQVINSSITADFTIEELCFAVRNPRTFVKTYGYGFPEIEALITTITSHLWAEEWNRRMFSQGSTIKGILNVKGNIPPNQFDAFKRMWFSQVSGVQNAWKQPILNSEEVQWLPLQLSNTEMGYQMWMEYLCFKSANVVTGQGIVPIQDVEPGDEVYTHTGELHQVLNTQKRDYCGQIVTIQAGGQRFEVTPEHPMYVAERARIGRERRIEFSPPVWIDAGDLEPGIHYLTVPKKTYMVVERDQRAHVPIDLLDHVGDAAQVNDDVDRIVSVKKFAHHTSSVNRYLPLDEDTAFAIGLYVAEGSATDKQVHFTFDAREQQLVPYVERLAERLGCQAVPYKAKETTQNVRISSCLAARFLKNVCGDGAHAKRVPQFILDANSAVQRAFFSGYFTGDGCVPRISTGAVVATMCSVSSVLVDQLRTMLFHQEIFSHQHDIERSDGVEVFRLDVNGMQAVKLSKWLDGYKGDRLRARIESHGLKNIKSRLFEDETYFYVPIHEMWSEHYEGPVYNLEVDVDNTYQVNRFATHNCKVTCALFRIDPAEINFDLRGGVGQQPVFMSTNEAQQKASKDRGLKPLLNFVEKTINNHVIWQLDPEFELEFRGLDAKTEEQAIELRLKQVAATHTLNEVRAMDNLPPVKFGDNVLNPVYIGYKTQMEALAMAPQQAGAGGQPQPTFQSPPGEHEEHAAEQIKQVAEPKDDESSGPSPQLISQLHIDDWSSTMHESLRADDLKKAEIYDIIDSD